MSPEIITFLMAATPAIERIAIPTAVFVWHIPVWQAFILGVCGMFLPVIPLLLFWEYFSEWLAKRVYIFNRFSVWITERSAKRHSKAFVRWDEWALFFFVALPIPILSGIYTGSVIAYVFKVPVKRAVLLMFFGIIVSNVIIAGATAAGSDIFMK